MARPQTLGTSIARGAAFARAVAAEISAVEVLADALEAEAAAAAAEEPTAATSQQREQYRAMFDALARHTSILEVRACVYETNPRSVCVGGVKRTDKRSTAVMIAASLLGRTGLTRPLKACDSITARLCERRRCDYAATAGCERAATVGFASSTELESARRAASVGSSSGNGGELREPLSAIGAALAAIGAPSTPVGARACLIQLRARRAERAATEAAGRFPPEHWVRVALEPHA